jgi:fumarate reductase flavoprotein subunit
MEMADERLDILVIGAGGCGLAAAIAAHDLGCEVVVVEKRERPGGNTAISTGSVPGAGTRFQRAAGIEDSPDRMLRDLTTLSGLHDADHLTRLLVNHSAELVEWMADAVGIPLDVVRDYKHVAHSVPRLHAPASRKGENLVNGFLRGLEKRGIPLALKNPVRQIETDERGAVTGAVVEDQNGQRHHIAASKVIVAVNGFGANRALLKRYCPDVIDATYVGALGSEGEAVQWGEALQAATGNMTSWQGYATVIHPHGELLSWTTIEKGGLVVNSEGRRFGDESLGYSGFTAKVLEQDGPVHAIFDETIRDIAAREPWFNEILDYGGAKRAESVTEIAAAIGVEPGPLEETMAAYNAAAAGQAMDAFGRSDLGVAPFSAPFWHTRVQPALLSTQGGMMVDEQAHVLRQDGGIIPNLFAGGGAVAGISGRSGPIGYASGNGLLHAIGLGWIAGQAAAAEIKAAAAR